MHPGLLHTEHHTCRQVIYLPVWRSTLDLVSAPGRRSSACLETRPYSDTLKQSRLIQQSIRTLHFLPWRSVTGRAQLQHSHLLSFWSSLYLSTYDQCRLPRQMDGIFLMNQKDCILHLYEKVLSMKEHVQLSLLCLTISKMSH